MSAHPSHGADSSIAINARDVTVSYGDLRALDRVDIEIGTGRVCGLLGTNGSGKSTLFKTLTGLVRPERGEVHLMGRTPRQARKQGLISYVPQSEDVDWTFPVTVADVVMMGRYGHLGPTRRPRAADREAVARAIELVGLTEQARKPIYDLSGGQRKRTFVARGIAQQAGLLLLDEPFAGVDKRSEAVITELLLTLRSEGKTIVISTHDLGGVPSLCDEAVLLQQRVVAHGPLDEVLAPETLAHTFGLSGETR
ncbi:metal ABC transporter ATP-binding protein [Parasphingorhabdus pacifica]